jgi:acyl-CoA synthetase (AMP-forming)/AMP-acid ligase II/aryl carrier-like protein
MTDVRTLPDLLRFNAQRKNTLTYLEGEHVVKSVSFAELEQRAGTILHELQERGAKRGDKLILFVASNEHFIDAFWGAALGAIVPVPVAIGINDEHRHKLLRIVRKLGNPFLFTDSKTLDRLRGFAEAAGEQQLFAQLKERTLLADQARNPSQAGRQEVLNPDDALFIQFSSGSTSEPKGVVLTHANVLANARGSTAAANFNESDVGLSWMPLTHDMGLVGMHLIMMYRCIPQHFMPTELFVRRPLLWMEFASRYKATITTSPNFGYRHFLKVLGDRAVDQWDLSALRLIFNGAEPIARDLCDEFMDRMAPAKLKRTAMFPVYGLAEASLAVSFPKPGSTYHSLTLDRHKLNVGETTVPAAADSKDAVELVAVGTPVPECEVRLCTDADVVVPEGQVGHLQIRGANVTRGYFEDAEANAHFFAPGHWLRTGDLGLFKDGELYITGRAKDIIFVNGQNYYPHDLEAIAQTAAGLELNKVVVAGVRPPKSATDELTVFVLHRGSVADFLPTAVEVSHLINERAGLEVAHVVPVKRIPKTTSGKLQRHLLVQEMLDGAFDAELRELAALRQPAIETPPTVAADASMETRLKAICDAILEDRKVGVNDNLFDVGVSSLKLVAIHERIDQEFPGMVDLTDIFDHPTIAELAKALESKVKQ